VPQTSAAFVENITIEEGFLDGLDLSFRPGLNVIIGPRGTGKTSIIELLRFTLGVPALTERFQQRARDHARAILGDGRVTVCCVIGGERFLVSRRHIDDEPEGDAAAIARLAPIVLSQNEIEAVGLDARGRTRLLDGFRVPAGDRDRERATVTKLTSLSAEIASLRTEIDSLVDQLQELDDARNALAAAQQEAEVQQKSVAAATGALKELDDLGTALASRSVVTAILERTIDAVEGWLEQLRAAARARPVVEDLPNSDETALDLSLSEVLASAEGLLNDAVGQVERARTDLADRLAAEREAIRSADDAAREQRRYVESIQEGASAAARRLATLRERVGQLEALGQVLAERRARLEERQAERRTALADLEQIRDQRFEARVAVARILTQALGPEIEVIVQRSGLAGDYSQAIMEVLRGSGLRYSQLAPQLAERMAPHELVRAAEEGDVDAIEKAGGIARDRAERVVERIRDQGVGRLLGAEVDDAAQFKLLVGPDYKDTTDLSTGQRCTTVLPVLLYHGERPVVIDQPEDHLDNAFIVDTLVRAIRRRPSTSQLIVSTHNPNVPVLGEAAQVTVLASDGKRGYVERSGELDDPPIVDSITQIMEGGLEAFERRARFYHSHESK
jgi:hypothetical protein